MKKIIIVDFGSQTAHLISRRVRDLGVEVEIVVPRLAVQKINKDKPVGIVFSGGPSSVYEKGAPKIDKKIFKLGIPILGICYGWQITAYSLGGRVVQGSKEYGPTDVEIKKEKLFKGISKRNLKVWMSHGDEVVDLPKGFVYFASSENIKAAAVGDKKRKIFGVQFHPEVEHTEMGIRMIRNFIEEYAGVKTKDKKLYVGEVVAQVRDVIDNYDKDAEVISAVSGGVDSTVASAIVAKAIGKRFIPVHVDNGLMRSGTVKYVEYIFYTLLKVKPIILKSEKLFLRKLKGVTDPEKKRKIIGKLYIDLFEAEARKRKNVKLLVQGTIYSDVIESQGTEHASKIKSHHNVGGLPKKMKLDLLEPVRDFYKDEVRELGRQLGLPEEVIAQQPFPGPGQAIRIMGEVTKTRLEREQQADQILLEVLRTEGWYEKVFQSFPVMTGAYSTAVKGDARVYGEVVALRIYESSDIMTAGWADLPYDVLQKISLRIVNEVEGVSRVVYDITTKPPATMEWE